MAFGQNENQYSGDLVNPETSHLKGPEYKNRRSASKSENNLPVSETRSDISKGPEYKNRNRGESSGVRVRIKRYDSKGPRYKRDRFHNK